MKAKLGLIARQQAAPSIALHRGTDDVRAIGSLDRRLVVYRRCGLDATHNAVNLEQRLRRARSPATKERWQVAIAFWNELSGFFGERVRTQCGEPF